MDESEADMQAEAFAQIDAAESDMLLSITTQAA